MWAELSIIFVNMWIGIPFSHNVGRNWYTYMNLPTEQIEAAEIDGASKFQIFKSITFPQNSTVVIDSFFLDSTIHRTDRGK